MCFHKPFPQTNDRKQVKLDIQKFKLNSTSNLKKTAFKIFDFFGLFIFIIITGTTICGIRKTSLLLNYSHTYCAHGMRHI